MLRKWASLKTSWTEGTTSPEPPTGRLSSSERLKARAAVHARMALHLRTHAALALPCKTKGTSWARALAKAVRNCAVSLSTSHQLRGPQAERGHFPRVAPPPTQHHRDQLPLAELYRLLREDTMVVSMVLGSSPQCKTPCVVNSGSTLLNQKFALVTTHEEEQEGCLSVLDPWMRWNRVACSLLFASRKLRTNSNSGWPIGTPSTSRPCWLVAIPFPHHCVWPHLSCLLVNSTDASGSTPPRFHTLVLP